MRTIPGGSIHRGQFYDEPCRISGIQFNHPQIRVVTPLFFNGFLNLNAGISVIFNQRAPFRAPVAKVLTGIGGLKSGAVAQYKDNGARGRVALRQNRREVAALGGQPADAVDPDMSRQAAAQRPSPPPSA